MYLSFFFISAILPQHYYLLKYASFRAARWGSEGAGGETRLIDPEWAYSKFVMLISSCFFSACSTLYFVFNVFH